MKREFTKLMAALALLTLMIPMGMNGQALVNTTLWRETWGAFTSQVTPSNYGFTGTTVYGNATLTYSQDDNGTKLYNEALAGGTAAELLLQKSNKTWTISNIPTGQATKMSLTFLSNKTTFAVTSSTTGITISGSQKSWTITAVSGINNFDLTIKNTGGSNARIDNIELVVTTAGGPSYTITAQSNNTEYGTVELSGSVITGTPKTGCRYASPAYTVSPANSATVAQNGNEFTVTPSANTTVTINFEAIPTYTVTFNTNGGTFVANEDFPELSNTKQEGEYTLPLATKNGYTFSGWLATGSANAVTGNYEVSGNVDFTAQWIPGVTDVLNLAFTGVTGTSYTDWSGKEGSSGAVYAGQSAGRYNAIQLRATSPSGIVTTTSGGAVKKVTVTWESNTQSGRVLNVYGKNTAYSNTTDLYGVNTAGDLLGTIVCGTSTELVISGDYAYIGLRSADNAMYLTQIEITWGSAAAVAAPTFEPGTTTFHGTQQITITAEEGADIRYTTDGTEPTATTGTVYNGPFSIDATTTVKAVAYATIEGETVTSAVAEAVYTLLYNITLTQPFHGSISCVAEAAAGTQVTVTATPDVNYQFGTLTVTPNATVSNNTFTMPASDVNVTATFVAASNTYTVSFSINDKTEMTATTTGSFNVDNFVAEVATEGMRFKGWYDNDTRVSGNYNPGTNKTLVAVFEEVSSAYTLVTSTDQLVAGNLVVIAANGDKNIAMAATQGNNNRGEATIIKTGNTISFPDSPIDDNPCELTLGKIVDGENTYWTFYDANVYNHTAYQNQGYLYAASSSSNWLRTQATNTNDGKWTISISSNNSEATIQAQGTNTRNILRYNSGSNCFSCYNTGQQNVLLYTKPASKAMRDVEVEATSQVTAIAANVVVTVKANGIVYLTGSNAGNSANLVVEEGGQLVTSANVDGTMQKTVTGYGSTTEASNYYLITAPSTINPQNVEYMLNTNGYDLYYFNQSAEDDVDGENVLLEWRNYKDEPFSLEAGTGYLYANKENKTLNLAGTLAKNDNNETFVQDITYVDGFRFSGWNLVGNPFPSNASVNMPFYKMKSSRDGINGTAVVSGSVIAPMEGVFVIAANSNAQQQVTFTATTDPVGSPAKNNVNIDVNRDNEFLDRAIVNFNGCTLSKLNLSENTTKVYFQQGQEEFAIVSVENEGELPVNFKASRNGRYTMSVDIEDLDMNYLHLIDNKTGMDIDLLQTPSYTFQASTGDNAYRFRLVFDANSVQENNTTANFAYFNGSEWVVNNMGEATLQVIDMMGRVLSSETLNGNANININQAAGIYMLRLVNGENVKVQKVVVR